MPTIVAECGSRSSIPRPSRRPTTAPSGLRWRAPAPTSSSSRAASSTGPCRRRGRLPGQRVVLPPHRRSRPRRARAPCVQARRAPPRHAALPAPRRAPRPRPLPVADGAAPRLAFRSRPRRWPAARPASSPRISRSTIPARAAGPASPRAAPPVALRRRRLHTEHGARRVRDAARPRPERVHAHPPRRVRLPDRLPDEAPLPPELAEVEGPGHPVLRPDPPLQGHRRPARGVPRGPGTRSCGSSACRGCRSSPCASWRRGLRGPVRFVPRFVPDAEIPAYSAAPTSSRCPTARSSSRACSTSRSPSASRSC